MISDDRWSQDQGNTSEHAKKPKSAAFTHKSIPLLCLQTPYPEVSDDLQLLGFEPGWGNTVARAKDTMNLALNLLEAPDSVRLFDFLSRMPNMFNVVILSPHGFFGQKDVLGKPDTGGQVGLPLYAMSLMYVDCYRLLVVLLCCCSCKLAGCSFACSCDTFRRHIPFFLLHFLPAFSQAVPCLHRPFFLCMYCASL